MTLTLAQRGAAQQQVLRRPATAPPATVRRFTVWVGASVPRHYRTIEELCAAARALVPAGHWDEIELLMKAGEGGSWQSAFDPHPLALNGVTRLLSHDLVATTLGCRVTPYVVVRGRAAWIAGEQEMIRECVDVTGRCVLNVEPGQPYWNGPNDPGFIRGYLAGCNVPARTLEVCMIPRWNQVEELGGIDCLQAWTDSTLVGSASWETYGIVSPGPGINSLQVDVAIPRLDGWGVPEGLQYRIPVTQRDERDRWSGSIWCAQGMAIWHIDGN